MKTEMTTPTWEDIVFEYRNKEYGAYSIRKSYNENVSSASLFSICLAALVLGAFQIASLMRIEIKVIPDFKSPEWTVLPNIIPVQPKQKVIPRHNENVQKDLPVKVVKHDVVDVTLIKPADLPQTGNDAGGTTTIDVGISGTEVGIDAVIPPVLEQPKIVDHPEVMPTYEGGLGAMVRFISRSIHYPAVARAVGQEGTVYVRFVINNLGQVVDVEVVRGVSAVLDKEATRVVTLMNKWKPGLQNNLPVNVRMVLPIRFQLEQ